MLKYSGFAFGLGQERVAMLRYGINDDGFYQEIFAFLSGLSRKPVFIVQQKECSMLVRVKRRSEASCGRLIATYQRNLWSILSKGELVWLKLFWQWAVALQLSKRTGRPKSETYFPLSKIDKIAGFLKFNWGQSANGHKPYKPLVQRIYVLKSLSWSRFGQGDVLNLP